MNTVPESPTIPSELDVPLSEPSDIDGVQEETRLEVVLQRYSLEIEQALNLNEELFKNEQMAHDVNGFEQYWSHVLSGLGPQAGEEIQGSPKFFEYLQDQARENYEIIKEKHQEFCEKTYNAARERVEAEMILEEDEFRDESLFHGGEDKLRQHLLRKVRDLKKTLKPGMYERLKEEVIEPLLQARIAEYQEKHQEFCEKTYNAARERVEAEMILEEDEFRDESLFHGGEDKLRQHLLRKVRDLKKTLKPGMYERLNQEVIQPLLDERIAEYMTLYGEREKERQKEEEDLESKEDAAREPGNQDLPEAPEGADAQAETEPGQDSAPESATESDGNASAESATESTVAEPGSAGENIQSNESTQSNQTIQTSESAQSNQTNQNTQTSQTVESSRGSETSQTSETAAQQATQTESGGTSNKSSTQSTESTPAKKPKKKEPLTQEAPDETFRFGELEGVRQLLARGEQYFRPLLIEWEKSLDSARHRKAVHEIMTKAKTAKDLIQWLTAGAQAPRMNMLQKKFPGVWKKFHHGLQLFGFTSTPPTIQKAEQERIIKKVETAEPTELTNPTELDQEKPKEGTGTKATLETEIGVKNAEDMVSTEPQDQEISLPDEEETKNDKEESKFRGEEPAMLDPEIATTPELEQEMEQEPTAFFESESAPSLEASEKEKDKPGSREIDEAFLEDILWAETVESESTHKFEQEIEETIILLEDDQEALVEIEELEESLWETLDDIVEDWDENEQKEEYAEEMDALEELFQYLIEEDMELTGLEETTVNMDQPEDANNEDREAVNPRNLRRLFMLLAALANENGHQKSPEKMTIAILFQKLTEQVSESNSPEIERKILTVLRYYPQFRFLLILMLRKLYLEAGNPEYIRLMMIIFQEQYGSKGMGLREVTEMLTRFLRFLGNSPEIHYCIHEALQDYAVLNSRELLTHLCHQVCAFRENMRKIQFITRRHHCQFDPLSGHAKALLHMNMEGHSICRKAIGKSSLVLADQRNFEVI